MNPRRRRVLHGVAAIAALARWADAACAQSSTAVRMPSIFVGHGSPMNVLADNAFTRQLRIWGVSLPRPTAILSVSAHWLTRGVTAVGSQLRPDTIHDFDGFPPSLYETRYPAVGAPTLAHEAIGLVHRTPVRTTQEWGLDHGTWTVLYHLFPKADVPVFQMSIDYDRVGAWHYAIGRELAALRERGVLVMGSGNIVHNLRATEPDVREATSSTRTWARSFDDAVAKALDAHDHDALIAYGSLDSGAPLAVPTPDHYWPLLYALGAARDEKPRTVFAGFHAGTISMRCVQFGA